MLVKHPKTAAGWEAVNAEKGGATVLVPFVNVVLVRRGNALVKARMNSFRMPETHLLKQGDLIEEYRNETHWPKHLMIK